MSRGQTWSLVNTARARFGSIGQLLTRNQIHAASIAVPTVHHLDVARPLLEAGIDPLIEKPVAFSLEDTDELIAIAKKNQRVVQVGHLERFNPAVRATLPLITRPMFFEVHRLSVFTARSLDVDVVLDLMIHDLDIVLTFVNSPVKEVRAVGLPILSARWTSPTSAWNLNPGASQILRRVESPPSEFVSCGSFNRDNIFPSITGGRMLWCLPLEIR